MKLLELMDRLKSMPLFSINDLAKITGLKASSVRMLSWRLSKKGMITRIERAKYAAIREPLASAAYLVRPSYIGLFSALRFHDMTSQIVNDIDIIVPKTRKKAIIWDKRVMFTKTKDFWGFERYKVGNFEVLVSDPEKTVIDCISSGKVRPHAVFEALKSREIDQERLLSYAKRCKNRALMKRVGFMLWKAGYDAKGYKGYAKGVYVRLDELGSARGTKNREWKIIENAVVE